MLIDAGAPVDAVTKAGWTPLHFAAYNGQAAAIRLLASRGASMDAADGRSDTALHLAIRQNQLGSADELLRMGAACTLFNAQGRLAWDDCAGAAAQDLLRSCAKAAQLAQLLKERPPLQPLVVQQSMAMHGQGESAEGRYKPGHAAKEAADKRATAQLLGHHHDLNDAENTDSSDSNVGSLSGWSRRAEAGQAPVDRAALLAKYRSQQAAARNSTDGGAASGVRTLQSSSLKSSRFKVASSRKEPQPQQAEPLPQPQRKQQQAAAQAPSVSADSSSANNSNSRAGQALGKSTSGGAKGAKRSEAAAAAVAPPAVSKPAAAAAKPVVGGKVLLQRYGLGKLPVFGGN